MDLTTSTLINRDNWDNELIRVLYFLFGDFGWHHQIRVASQIHKRGDLRTSEQLLEEVNHEMWERVRFFQAKGYCFEPPEFPELTQQQADEMNRLLSLVNGEPGIFYQAGQVLRNPCEEV